jgi:hemoglobin
MKRDIETADDIKLLIDTFYKKILTDDIIGYFFTRVIKLDWDRHIPIMYSFWETMLLGKTSYRGNPMMKHIDLNRNEKLEQKHFDQWLKLWGLTIDEIFEGSKCKEAKSKAETIARLMMIKIEDSKADFIQ